MPRRTLERSPYYREFLCSIDAHREVELYLRERGAVVGGVSLLRDATAPAFAPHELAVLRTVHPFVEYTFGVDRRLGLIARAVDGLTPRETDVVRLVCRGAGNREIGRALGIALQTVKTHLEHVYRKLGVRTRAQLIAEIAAAPKSA
jgi:DNA-binding CsgD family transcriptional regulator